MVSMITLMADIVPLEKRSSYFGFFGGVFGIAVSPTGTPITCFSVFTDSRTPIVSRRSAAWWR
jgi:hypothetical protein